MLRDVQSVTACDLRGYDHEYNSTGPQEIVTIHRGRDVV